VPDPSGIASVGGVVNSQFVLVSDKRNALFRGTLDRSRKRFLVGPPIPLRGFDEGGLDLEGVAFDRWSATVFLAAESDSSVLRATAFGDVMGRLPTGFPGGDDGVEGLALRRKLDGTPLLYVFKERMGMTGAQPPAAAFELDEPFALLPRAMDLKLPLFLPDQTAAMVADERLYVVSRFARGILETGLEETGFGKDARSANFRALAVALGLEEGKLGMLGNVEGIAMDPRGDLFLLVDNNGEVVGKEELGNRGREGRLLWFRNLLPPGARPAPPRVLVKHIHVPFKGAKDAGEDVMLSEEDARKLAEDVARRARAGEDFETLASSPLGGHYAKPRWGREIQVVREGTWPGPQVEAADLPVALARLAFNLDVGEVGLASWHREESPYGFHVLLRAE
jgi:uncharacterized protein YjiK